jgi:CheY-like chemotaxis protein
MSEIVEKNGKEARSPGNEFPVLPEMEQFRDTECQQEKLNILLVEDNLVNQEVALAMLKKRGHTVTIANNGQEALEILDKNLFDIILMDVQMPVMNGYEATHKIRQKEKVTGNHLIIIGLTASNMKGDKEKCLEAGMDDFVSKPMRIKDLMHAIASVAPER